MLICLCGNVHHELLNVSSYTVNLLTLIVQGFGEGVAWQDGFSRWMHPVHHEGGAR